MSHTIDQHTAATSYSYAGMATLALRLVTGWTYFSAFWRRVVLENKLNPEEAGYVGEKFNHFLPNALGIKPIIEYLVSNPDALWWSMVGFTIVEGIVGLLFMLGFFTRLMSIGVFSLAMGILLGSGWLGTTCLDEWQIGILGIAAGFSLFLSGGGNYSLDHLFFSATQQAEKKWNWLTSGILPVHIRKLQVPVVAGSLLILFIALFTNQYFHGGVYGELHNKSVKPKVEVTEASIINSNLEFNVFRVEGADVYGSFLIGVHVEDESGNIIFEKDHKALSQVAASAISNRYVAKVKPGKHSLILPLGAKATLTFRDTAFETLPKGNYRLVLTDISGLEWDAKLVL